jgi:flagellar biogenesis protein FliO
MLEPIFGQTGALVAQFAITLVVVLLLLAVVVWLVRRYSRGGLAGGGRGRLPRLAIVDAMAVDNRRKLVLVRRDNVEHLILIGGPSDLVVEPGIMRQRTAAGQRQSAAQQPAAGQQAVAAQSAPPAEPAQPAPSARPAVQSAARSLSPAPAPSPPPPPVTARTQAEAVGADQPIPFPPRRSPATGRAWLRRDSQRRTAEEAEPEDPRPARSPPASTPAGFDLDTAGLTRPLPASARFVETARPTAIQPSFSLVTDAEPELPPPLDADEPEAIAAAAFPEAPQDTAAEFAVPESETDESGRPAEPPAAVPGAAAPAPGQPETSVKVSDLEKEMARLLGEISTSRSS